MEHNIAKRAVNILSARRCLFVSKMIRLKFAIDQHTKALGSFISFHLPFHVTAMYICCCKTARPMHCVWNMHANDNIYYLVWNENLLSLECLWVMFWCLSVRKSARANVWICLCESTRLLFALCSRPILHKIYWWNCHYSYTKPTNIHIDFFIDSIDSHSLNILHLFMHLNCVVMASVCVCEMFRCDKPTWQRHLATTTNYNSNRNSSYRWESARS